MVATPVVREANEILARLPKAEYARILSASKLVNFPFKEVLCEANEPVKYVWFPRTGVLSAIVVTLSGGAIEAANIGKEGVFGWTAVFAAGTSPHRMIAQVPGQAVRMDIKTFKADMNRNRALRELLLRYNSAFLTQVSQSVACNGLHTVRERCCRWLLMSHDRVQSDKLPLTHEFLAIMIGVHRPGVTNILGSLKDAGLIRSTRGSVTILDRKRLEDAACECYRTVTDEYDRLFSEFPILD